MAPAAFSTSSSGGSSPPTSPSTSTRSVVFADEAGDLNFGAGRSGNAQNEPHYGGATPTSRSRQQAPIAVVGMSCRLPGGASSPAEFWELCSRARSGFSAGAPKDRFNHEAFYDPNPGKTGTYHSQGGYFLNENITAFDAPFFSLTEKEAIAMDPQQRLLLECTFEALESSGIPKHTVVGGNVGCFIGGSLSEYETHISRDSESMPMYQSTGCAQAMQSNRLSHFFDLRGPSFTLDTACSSSLVALHVACQSLRNGESSIAVTGGCHLNMLPDSFISFSTGRLLSDSGRSIAFDERGTGFGRGEGCGILVLKPLDQALEDKDAIRAVIVGTGINQDGKTAGITMPNGDAQETLIKQVYRDAGIDPKDCGFVEAHGTGTKIGDPTEAGAIHRALGQDRSVRDPLFIGSVKSNIGHLEAASGVAAVIKAALMLERGFILPNHDFKTPNKKIPWKEWHMAVPKAQRPWPKGKKYISVNNFGFGGTNAHVVLEKAPFPMRRPSAARKQSVVSNSDHTEQAGMKRMFLLSGNDKKSLEAVMANLVVYLEQRPEIFQSDLLEHLSYTLCRRSLLKWRVAIPAVTSFELIEALNSNSTVPSKAATTGQGPYSDLKIGFVFTGQGAQWHAMGRELYGQNGYDVYTAGLDKADRYLQRMGADWSLTEELTVRDAATSKVSEAHVSQPACTVVQLCLVDLLRSWGIRPAAVTGHSSGEIAAAYAAGFISFESAVVIAYQRGRMIPILKKTHAGLQGAMMAVGGSKEEIQPLIDTVNSKLEKTGEKIRIACYNSPSSLTISGDGAGITLLEETIRENQPDTFNRRLQVDVAYHSHHMDLVAKQYMEALKELPEPRTLPNVDFYSSLHGRKIEGHECNAKYWVDNLTRPVRFSEALDCMVTDSREEAPVNMLIELGPHSALQGPIKQILQAAGVAKTVSYAAALQRKKDAVQTALELASVVVSKGGPVRVEAINLPHGRSGSDKPTLLTDLPRYAWNHQSKYWHESRITKMHTQRNINAARSDLIGVEAVYSTNLEPTWRNVFSLDDLPWLRHHQIQGLTVFPLAGFVAMAVEAASQKAAKNTSKSGTSHFNTVELKDVEVTKPLAFPANVVDGNGNIELSISLRRRHDPLLREEWDEFRISSWSTSSEWTEHCAGLVMTKSSDNLNTTARQTLVKNSAAATTTVNALEVTATDMSAMYEKMAEDLGIGYGTSFQGIQNCKVAGNFALGKVSQAPGSEEAPVNAPFLHATAVESLIEMYWPILRSSADNASAGTVFLPSSIRHMSIRANSATDSALQDLTAHCTADFSLPQDRPVTVDIVAKETSEISDVDSILVAIDGLTISPILEGNSSDGNDSDGAPRQICYKYEWQEVSEEDAAGIELSDLTRDSDIVIIHGPTSSPSYLLANQLAVTLESVTSRLPILEGGVFEDANSGTAEQIASIASGKTCIVLNEIDDSFLAEATEFQFEALKSLASSSDRVLWLSHDAYLDATLPGANMISGLSRSIRAETTMPFVHLDLQHISELSRNSEAVSDVIVSVLRLAFGGTGCRDMEFVHRDGKLLVPRVVGDGDMDHLVKRDTDPNALELQTLGEATAGSRALRMELQPAKTISASSGGSQDVHFVEDSESADLPLADDEIEFAVKAVGVSGHDSLVMNSPASSASAGLEAAGIVTRIGALVEKSGIHVGSQISCLTTAMTRGSHGALSNLARAVSATTLQMPEVSKTCMSFEQAASLPLAYSTAYYSLLDQARLEAGQRVLVTNPSAPAGQAAINLALVTGAEVFAVVKSSEEKAAVLRRHEAALPEAHIVITNGHDARESYDALMRATNGAGADVVISSVTSTSEEKHLQQLWTACLAPFGCLVKIQEPRPRGSQHQSSFSRPGLHEVRPTSSLDNVVAPGNTSCIAVDMLALAAARPQVFNRVFAKVAGLLEAGQIKPIKDLTVLPFSRAHEAFRVSRDRDDIPQSYVLQADPEDQILAPPAPVTSNIFKPDATYLIVGGTGGLGRSMTRWLMQHGAKHIVLLSRRATKTPALEALIAEAETSGAHIYIQPCNIADKKSVSDLLAWITTTAKLPRVRGLIHSAMVLHDVLFEKMTHAEYKAVIESKVQGAMNLHNALDGSKEGSAHSTPLDFFVAISSVSAVVGNRGQAAYAAANTYLDALVQHRLTLGLPAVSLALAAVSDAGYLADAEGGAARAADVLRNLGGDASNTICEAEVLALLHAAVTGKTASSNHHVITGVSMGEDRKKALPFWADDAKFVRLADVARAEAEAEAGEDGKGAATATLTPSLSQAEAEEVVCRGLVVKIAEVLMMEEDELDVTRSLSHYPLDSLVAIEIRNFIARQYEASLQVLELLSSGSIQTLSNTVCRKSKLCQF